MLALKRRISGGIMAISELVLAVSWLVIAAVLVLDLVGITHRGTGYRVMLAGILFTNTAGDVNVLAHPRLRDIFPVIVVGFAIIVIGMVIWSRGRRAA